MPAPLRRKDLRPLFIPLSQAVMVNAGRFRQRRDQPYPTEGLQGRIVILVVIPLFEQADALAPAFGSAAIFQPPLQAGHYPRIGQLQIIYPEHEGRMGIAHHFTPREMVP